MQFTLATVIAASREQVWRTFADADARGRWQPTFVAARQIQGEAGEAGSIAELVYNDNGRGIVVTETAGEMRPPEYLVIATESQAASGEIEHIFSPLDDGSTRWGLTANFRIRGLAPTLMSVCLRGVIAGRYLRDMRLFKRLVEAGHPLARAA